MNAELHHRVALSERALSLTQPWAWLIVSMPGLNWKNVENRKPGFSHKSFRGDFLVHAAGTCTKSDYASAYFWVKDRFGDEVADRIPRRESLPRMEVVGIVEAMGLVSPGSEPRERWHMQEQYGFLLRRRAELPRVRCKGALGFWRVPAAVKRAILSRLEEEAIPA